ncbi:L,D-transpeptidase family protein [Aquibium sp. ELW1220]|uniref:L,D-transpeptidase family protein n=1 Tax=Aquibium sp. ELW1220 TaxID=2976766 RepID=UPI0025B0D133|nr:L,D-transpeptidase family protein [Aquibium sp. ELW1220]MDN2581326.1 L,D-transpeptidase family protein [Aquibium sp. ELW1220]
MTIVPALILGTLIGGAATPAHAENLFKMLFGGGIQQRERERRADEVLRPQAAPAPVVKISAPSYRAYKADPLVSVSFRTLLEAPRSISFEPSLDGGSFVEALQGLDGFELAAEKPVAKAIEAYYAAHEDFIWVSGTSVNTRAVEVLRVLGEAASYGLDPADYAVRPPSPGFDMTDMPARHRDLIRFEMALSARVLRYVRDAFGGRIDPNRISGYYDFPEKPLDLEAVLGTLARTQDVRPYLESRHPQNERYQALRAELEVLRAGRENDIVVDAKLFLKPGGTSPELPKLLQLFSRETDDAFRAEHAAVLSANAATEAYGPELVAVVKAAQAFKGLSADGIIGPRTVSAFAGVSKADRIAKVEVALEQLRWHPSDLGSPRVFINQPAYTATYNEGGEDRLSMRVVVGKVSNQTSFFFDEIEQIDYNPYWGVPQSILVNEMLPRLRQDPGYLDRSGYEITDAKGRRISSSSINWYQYGGKVPYNVRQTPSEANALGELKILFPNKHAIYMHDTPSKSLFQRDARAFSHGCVRLSDPRAMAAAVLGKPVEHVADKIRQGHSTEKVTRKIPVYVAYFTAWPDQSGTVEYFDDVYDRDSRLLKALEATAEVRAPTS